MNKDIQSWPLDKLKPHPLQGELFGDLNQESFEDLKEDMRLHGLICPVEALRTGTILCGHQRVRAAKELGWKQIDVWVRDDLAKRGEVACDQRVIEDNLIRRQLGGLAKTRCLVRLKELELEEGGRKGAYDESALTRDAIAKKLNCSGRTADRYLRVAKAPVDVQDAFDRGEISLVDAGKVAGLQPAQQQALAAKIRAGESARQVVAEALKCAAGKKPFGYFLKEFKYTLVRCEPELLSQLSMASSITDKQYAVLHRARALLDALLEHARTGIGGQNGQE